MPAGTPAKDQSTTPDSVDGPVHDPELQPEQQVHRRPESELRRARFGGNVPQGNPDKMTVDDLQRPGGALRRRVSGQADYDFNQVSERPPRRAAEQVRDQIKIYTPANTFYFFMNNRDRAVRQPQGAAGGQLRDRPRGARAHLRRARDSRRRTSFRRPIRSTRRSTCTRTTSRRRSS